MNSHPDIERKVDGILDKIWYNVQKFLDLYKKKELDLEGKEYIWKFVLTIIKDELKTTSIIKKTNPDGTITEEKLDDYRKYNILANYLNKKGYELFVENKYFYSVATQTGTNVLTIQFLHKDYWNVRPEIDPNGAFNNTKNKWSVSLKDMLMSFLIRLYEDGQV